MDQKENKKTDYPYLPEGREILLVDLENKFMQAAKKVRDTKSTDLSFSTGAVVVLDGEVVGEGANQSLLRTPFLLNIHKKWACVRKWFSVPSGKKYWMCPGCAASKDHAETRASLNAGEKTKGADLYLYGHWWCCKSCWDAMIKTGIKNVYLLEGGKELFDHRG